MICIGLLVVLILPDSPLRNPLKKMFLSENVIFGGLRLSFGHFGQQAPKSHASQLQNGVSTSSLPPFIVELLTFKDCPRSNSFFQWKFYRVLNGKHRERLTLIHWFFYMKTEEPFCDIFRRGTVWMVETGWLWCLGNPVQPSRNWIINGRGGPRFPTVLWITLVRIV